MVECACISLDTTSLTPPSHVCWSVRESFWEVAVDQTPAKERGTFHKQKQKRKKSKKSKKSKKRNQQQQQQKMLTSMVVIRSRSLGHNLSGLYVLTLRTSHDHVGYAVLGCACVGGWVRVVADVVQKPIRRDNKLYDALHCG